ncbi:MAG: ribosome maturation factor RimM [Proteocatella sp.]
MKKHRIGQIVNTHGLKGEMKVYPLTDYPERFEEIGCLYLENDGDKKLEIEKVRYQKKMVLLKIKGIETIEEVEKIRERYLLIDESDRRNLDEDEHMISDLLGLNVYLEDGTLIGSIKDVLQYAANDVYVIKNDEGKEYLVPALKQFIPVVDVKNNKVIITPIKGMLE